VKHPAAWGDVAVSAADRRYGGPISAQIQDFQGVWGILAPWGVRIGGFETLQQTCQQASGPW
jgi:hypothetical protein